MGSYRVTFGRSFAGKSLGDQDLVVNSTNDVTAIYDAIDVVEARNDGVDYRAVEVAKM
jgi:hypothetical protein